jgi:hypothetical protein
VHWHWHWHARSRSVRGPCRALHDQLLPGLCRPLLVGMGKARRTEVEHLQYGRRRLGGRRVRWACKPNEEQPMPERNNEKGDAEPAPLLRCHRERSQYLLHRQ